MALEYFEDQEGIWTSHTDPKSGTEYGLNVASGKVMWDIPRNAWKMGRDVLTGRYYYYNLSTHQSTWARPAGPVDGEEPVEPGFEFQYDGSDGQGMGVGFVPIHNPDMQAVFWHNAATGQLTWQKPEGCLSTVPDMCGDDESAMEEEARQLQARVNKAKTVNEESRRVMVQLQRTAEQRLETVRALGQSKKLRNVNQNNLQRTARHMEGNIEPSQLAFGAGQKSRANPALAASFLRSVPLFHSLDDYQFSLVQQNLQAVDFPNGTVIVRQDSPGDLFYLLYRGQVRVFEHNNGYADYDSGGTRRGTSFTSMNGNHGHANLDEKDEDEETKAYGVVVNELKSGDYFGERALLNGTPRTSTVIAVGDVSCFVLDKEIFSSVVTKELIEGESSALSHSNEEVSSLARHIGNYEGLLLMKARARDPTDKKIADALLALVSAFSPELAVDDTLERFLKTLYAVFEVERISLFYVDWETEELILQMSKDTDMREIRLPMGAGLVGACARSTKIVNVPDVTKDPRFFGDMDKKSGFTTRCVLCCPILDGEDRATAVIQLVNKRVSPIFSKDDEDVLAAVAEQMALTLAHKKIEMQQTASTNSRTIPLWQVEDNMKVSIKKFYNNDPAGATPPATAEPQVIVEVQIYHAGIELTENGAIAYSKTQSIAPVLSATFPSEELDLGIQILNLPRAARIIFNVSFAAVDEKGQIILNSDKKPQPGIAIGWGGATLFNFDQILRAGHMRIKLFPGRCTPELAGVATLLTNTTKKDVDILDVEICRFSKPVVFQDIPNFRAQTKPEKETDLNPNKKDNSHVVKLMIQELKTFINKDPLYKLKPDDKQLILQARNALKSDPSSLSKYLQAVPWNSARDVQEAYRMLYQWETPGPVDALTLLDHTTPDPKVRALAVSLLEGLDDNELVLYLLQLTQVLKFEPFIDSALARFLLRRALRSPKTVGQSLFWLFKAEMHVPEVRERFTCLHRLFQRHCGEINREATGHQEYVLRRLGECATKVKSIPKAERNEAVRKLLRGIVFPEHFQLPIKPELAFKGLNLDKCRVMSSKKAPLWLNFISATPNTPPLTVLYKQGDDLRQDQLTLQVLRVIDLLWKTEDMDLQMSCYGAIATGYETGLIEVVGDAETIGGITAGKGVRLKKIRAMANVYDERRIKKWLKSKGHPQRMWEQNFLKSCAGYAVATFVLGIGDRHNDNIMLTSTGKFFHIDFGHFLGNFKKKLGVRRERAPFVFTPAMAFVLGGSNSPLFKEFEQLCCRAYNVLRKHSNLLITLFSLMLQCGIPELETDGDIVWLREKLLIGSSEEEASKYFIARIHEALTTRTVQLNDAVHMLVHA